MSTAIVIDHGTATTRVGFAGQEAPSSVFPSIVGYYHNEISKETYCVGNDAISKQDVLTIKHPLSGGTIDKWDEMDKLWHYIYDSVLCTASDQHPVLLTEPPFNYKSHRERMTQVMFEQFNVPAMYVIPNTVLSLFASGRTTGVVFTSGGGIRTTYAVPIYEGHAIPNSSCRLQFGGDMVTDALQTLLSKRYPFITSVKHAILSDIKEKVCYVALDFKKELNSVTTNSKEYTLPDGQLIHVGKERFCCPEGLFQPKFLQMESYGIHDLIYNTIMKSDTDIRKNLFTNIVLYGGATMFPGITDRLQKEIINLVPSQTKVKIIAPPERAHSAWVGGALLACMPNFKHSWISKAEYDEFGPTIVHRKCF